MDGNRDFAAQVVPLLEAELNATHHGDMGPRLALWTRNDPVTLFGAWLSARGWDQVSEVFDNLARIFRDTGSLELEVVAADCSGDLGYVVALEKNTGVVTGDGTRDYTLRVTTILRREDGAWKVVHRHGDELPVTAP
jgi:ketosteroid isomerase-like protein